MMNPHDFEKAERAHELANSLSIPFCTAWKIAACVTKVAYATEGEARKKMESQPSQKPYKCPICGRWHMTTCAPKPAVPAKPEAQTQQPQAPAVKKRAAQPQGAQAVKKNDKRTQYVEYLVKIMKRNEWTSACAIGQAMHQKFPHLDVKRDLGCKKFSEWVDSTQLMEKKKTNHGNYYRVKSRLDQ